MATRSITTVRSQWVNDGDTITDEWKTNATIYVHWDGYLDGVGRFLHNFLNGLVVVNGISPNMPLRYANGPGRLAAQLIVAMENDGMKPECLRNGSVVGQEYHYQIDVAYGRDGGNVLVTVFDGPMTAFGCGGDECTNQIFHGNVEEFGIFLAEYDEDEDEDEDE